MALRPGACETFLNEKTASGIRTRTLSLADLRNSCYRVVYANFDYRSPVISVGLRC